MTARKSDGLLFSTASHGLSRKSSATTLRIHRFTVSWWKRACQCCFTSGRPTWIGGRSSFRLAIFAKLVPMAYGTVTTRSDSATISGIARKWGTRSATRRVRPCAASVSSNNSWLFVTSLPLIKDGKLKALAVASPTRSAALPNVPTMAEAGVPGIEMDQWFGMFAPAGTPAPVVAKLYDELVKAVRSPGVSGKITAQGLDVMTTTPAEFAALMRDDAAKLGKVVKDSGARAD